MARTVQNKKLDTRSARAKLVSRREPYWTSITPGCALGYRKGAANGGTWIARHYAPDRKPRMRYTSLGATDDIMDADGVAALSFAEAQEMARTWFAEQAKEAHDLEPMDAGPYTVDKALDAYIAKLEAEARPSLSETRSRTDALIRAELGKTEIQKLTADRLRRWLNELANSPARLRTKKGAPVRFRAPAETDDAKRARRSNANRTWAVLRAALNLAFADGKVSSDAAWRRVKPFRGADAARVRYLTVDEAQRLINACASDFRNLVTAALLTGARFGELARLNVDDFDPDAGTIVIRQSKSGHARHVFLTDEGKAFISRLTAGRQTSAPMLAKHDGARWQRSHQIRPMAEACKVAKLAPPIGFHGLRHTYASLAVMRGAPLPVVAHNLGHTSTRMVEKHYGHLAPSYVAETIRDKAPTFGIKPDGKIAPLRGGQRRKADGMAMAGS